jgi:hypothetical protein
MKKGSGVIVRGGERTMRSFIDLTPKPAAAHQFTTCETNVDVAVPWPCMTPLPPLSSGCRSTSLSLSLSLSSFRVLNTSVLLPPPSLHPKRTAKEFSWRTRSHDTSTPSKTAHARTHRTRAHTHSEREERTCPLAKRRSDHSFDVVVASASFVAAAAPVDEDSASSA